MENIWNEIIRKITEEKNPVLPVKFSDSYNDEAIIAYCNTMLCKIDSFNKGETSSKSANPCPLNSQDL